MFDLVIKAIIKIPQVVTIPIQAAKPAKAKIEYGLTVENEAEALKNLAKLNQVLDECEVTQQLDQQALALMAELNNGGGLHEI